MHFSCKESVYTFYIIWMCVCGGGGGGGGGQWQKETGELA